MTLSTYHSDKKLIDDILNRPSIFERFLKGDSKVTKEAKRFNAGKVMLAYILQFQSVAKVIARIKEFGAVKYGDGNWKSGNKPDKEYLDSMMRHLGKYIEGEIYDQDSGCSHIGHAIWNLMALQELNHPDEIIDEELFKKQCAKWAKEVTND